MPKTKLGKWSCLCLVVFIVSLLVTVICFEVLGFKRGSVEILVPAIFTGIAGISTFVTGAVSLLKLKDRSIIVIIATIAGFLAFLLIVMELLERIW